MSKIDAVTLDLFRWDDIPATQYGQHTGTFGGASQLGLLTVRTTDGVKGHAFLGSASRGAQMDGESLIHYLKPILMGQNPLERERLYKLMYRRTRSTTLRAIGAADIALWDIAGQIAGLPIAQLIGQYRDKLPAYASSAVLAHLKSMPQRPSLSATPAGLPTKSIPQPVPTTTSRSAKRSAQPSATTIA